MSVAHVCVSGCVLVCLPVRLVLWLVGMCGPECPVGLCGITGYAVPLSLCVGSHSRWMRARAPVCVMTTAGVVWPCVTGAPRAVLCVAACQTRCVRARISCRNRCLWVFSWQALCLWVPLAHTAAHCWRVCAASRVCVYLCAVICVCMCMCMCSELCIYELNVMCGCVWLFVKWLCVWLSSLARALCAYRRVACVVGHGCVNLLVICGCVCSASHAVGTVC